MTTNESCMVELCLSIATQAHKGQTEKVGLPVILHPLMVGLMGKTPEEMCVGFLHDYIESLIASGNRLALAVKRNDLTHNHGRAIKYGFKAQEEKCAKALAMIGDILP